MRRIHTASSPTRDLQRCDLCGEVIANAGTPWLEGHQIFQDGNVWCDVVDASPRIIQASMCTDPGFLRGPYYAVRVESFGGTLLARRMYGSWLVTFSVDGLTVSQQGAHSFDEAICCGAAMYVIQELARQDRIRGRAR